MSMPDRRERFKVLLVDFDGVITSLDIDWSRVRERISELVGEPVESVTLLLRRLWGTRLYWQVSRVIEDFELEALTRAEPLPGSVEGLNYAKGLGLKIYIASLQAESVIRGFLHAWKLENLVDAIFSREYTPWKTVMALSASLLEGVKMADMVFIDDNERNLREVASLGVWAVDVKGFSSLYDALRACCGRASRYQ